MWNSDCNNDNKFDNFSSSLGSAESSGDWSSDYLKCCETQKIIPCPYFKVSETSSSSSSCRLLNTAVDLASWRAMLVASAMKSTKVEEIVCHNVKIKHQHLVDMLAFVKNSDLLKSIKLDYIEFESEGEGEESTSLGKSLLTLLAECGNLKYISLKGNGLDSEFATSLGETLMTLPCLEAVNISENNINDEGLAGFCKAFPFCISLSQISMKKNPITADGLKNVIVDLAKGHLAGSTGDQTLKAMMKIVADKNKQIQAANKARKKSNLPEIPEIVVPSNRVMSVPDEENRILNRTIGLLNLSFGTFEGEGMGEFIDAAVECSATAPSLPEGATPLVIQLRGLNEESMVKLTSQDDIFLNRIIVRC